MSIKRNIGLHRSLKQHPANARHNAKTTPPTFLFLQIPNCQRTKTKKSCRPPPEGTADETKRRHRRAPLHLFGIPEGRAEAPSADDPDIVAPDSRCKSLFRLPPTRPAEILIGRFNRSAALHVRIVLDGLAETWRNSSLLPKSAAGERSSRSRPSRARRS